MHAWVSVCVQYAEQVKYYHWSASRPKRSCRLQKKHKQTATKKDTVLGMRRNSYSC